MNALIWFSTQELTSQNLRVFFVFITMFSLKQYLEIYRFLDFTSLESSNGNIKKKNKIYVRFQTKHLFFNTIIFKIILMILKSMLNSFAVTNCAQNYFFKLVFYRVL